MIKNISFLLLILIISQPAFAQEWFEAMEASAVEISVHPNILREIPNNAKSDSTDTHTINNVSADKFFLKKRLTTFNKPRASQRPFLCAVTFPPSIEAFLVNDERMERGKPVTRKTVAKQK